MRILAGHLMYFILSKILLFVLVPINWVLLLFVMAAVKFNKPNGRRYLITAIIFLYLFSIPLLLKCFTRLWDVETTVNNAGSRKYSCVIVLGGFSGSDSKGNGRFTWAADRFIIGAQQVTSGKALHILITGGDGSLVTDGFREAPWAKQQLKKLGIADSLILTESKSRNTLENAGFTKAMLDSNKLKPPYLLVTSAFHMRRAKMIFNKKGMDVVPYSCSYLINSHVFELTDLLPQAAILSNWSFYTKEMVGYVANYYAGN